VAARSGLHLLTSRRLHVRRIGFVLGIALVAVALGAAILAPRGSARPSAPAAAKVTVTATEFKFKLSKKIVPKGKVTFLVVNKGTIEHDFKIAGKKTPLIQPKKSAKLVVVFKKKGKYPYVCTVPGHAAAGMKGVLTVTG